MISFYLIRRKCVQKKNGEWKTISCQQTTLRSLLFGKEHDICDCQEKRLQKKFIQKHVSRKLRHNKFINSRSRLVGFSFFKRALDSEIQYWVLLYVMWVDSGRVGIWSDKGPFDNLTAPGPTCTPRGVWR